VKLLLYYITVVVVIVYFVIMVYAFIRDYDITYIFSVFILVMSIIVVNIMFDIPFIERVDNIDNFKKFELMFNAVKNISTTTRKVMYDDGKLIINYKYAGMVEVKFIKIPGLGVWGISEIKYIKDLYNEAKKMMYDVMVE